MRMQVRKIDKFCELICLQIFHDLFCIMVAFSVNYLTRDKVCNGESAIFRSISYVIFYISFNNHIFFTQIITVIKASEPLHGFYINKLTP